MLWRGTAGYTTASGHRYDSPPAINTAPTANAGSNQTIHAGTPVQLDGTGSFDDNTPKTALQYNWSFLSVPDGSTAPLLNGNTTATPSFTPNATGDYVVQLIVTDDGTPALASAPAYVTLSGFNQAPTAVITATPTTIPYTGQTVWVDGSGSTDPEHDPITYAWTVTARPLGSTAPLVNPTSVFANLTRTCREPTRSACW